MHLRYISIISYPKTRHAHNYHIVHGIIGGEISQTEFAIKPNSRDMFPKYLDINRQSVASVATGGRNPTTSDVKSTSTRQTSPAQDWRPIAPPGSFSVVGLLHISTFTPTFGSHTSARAQAFIPVFIFLLRCSFVEGGATVSMASWGWG